MCRWSKCMFLDPLVASRCRSSCESGHRRGRGIRPIAALPCTIHRFHRCPDLPSNSYTSGSTRCAGRGVALRALCRRRGRAMQDETGRSGRELIRDKRRSSCAERAVGAATAFRRNVSEARCADYPCTDRLSQPAKSVNRERKPHDTGLSLPYSAASLTSWAATTARGGPRKCRRHNRRLVKDRAHSGGWQHEHLSAAHRADLPTKVSQPRDNPPLPRQAR